MRQLFVGLILMAPCAALTAAAAQPEERELEEVVVTGTSARQRLMNVRLGAEQLEMSSLMAMPSMFGENDLLKSISLMPGVRSEGEASSGIEVRGGAAWQNLITLNGITLYNPSHVGGIFSTFNDAALGGATLFKGPVPAAYGGASSAVLEAWLASGNPQKYKAAASIGILAAKIAASGPVVKDRLTFSVAARRSYFDTFLKLSKEYRSTVMHFYDVSADMRLLCGGGDYLDATFFISHDNMALKDLMGMDWGNIGGSLNWSAHAGDRLRFLTTAAVTHYAPDMGMEIVDVEQRMNQYIRNYAVNEKGTYTFSDSYSLDFGLRSELLRVRSCEINLNGNLYAEERSGWENALWLNFDGRGGRLLEFSVGARLSLFSALSGRRFHYFKANGEPLPDFGARTYVSFEPRGSLKFNISEQHNIKLGAGVSTQNIHALRTSTTSFPFDRYALTSAGVKPEKSIHYGLGYTGATADGDFDWSAEGYYRDMRDIYDYLDGKSMFSAISIESLILGGRGRSYGAEFMLRKNNGPVTGWVAYTISKTQTKIAGINGGRWYDATNDRRHDVAIAAIWKINRKWRISGAWTFMTGTPLTAPEAKYELNGATCYYHSARNSYRIPSSHKLDIGATWTKRHKHGLKSEIDFGITNAYCHYNPFVVYFTDDPKEPSGTKAMQTALYGFLPSISYTLSFEQ